MSGIEELMDRGPAVVRVKNLSMAYKLYTKPIDLMKEAIFGGVRHDTFWALRDVSLTVHEGERVGIVGPNGAGKSTLLQVIAGNLQPTSGVVSVSGRISSLLSQAPAWNAEETGIQNIRFNLAIQGVPEKRISQLIEEIIDFTELGAFIYHPVKTYSTGMGARLMFALATAIDPEILIIDEVLGAGDGYFAGKAAKRMQEFCARGRALLFVSHSPAAVQQMCNKAVWIHNGSIRLQGEAEYVLKQYELDFRKAEDEAVRARHIAAAAQRTHAVTPDEVPDGDCLRFRIVADKARYLSGTHFIREIRVQGIGDRPIEVPLEFADLTQVGCKAALDLLGAEWGRVHERNGNLSRSLARATGRRLGGQFIVKLPGQITSSSLDIRIDVDSSSTDASEELMVETLDMVDGSWRPLACTGRRRASGGWQLSKFSATVAIPQPEQALETAQTITKNALPDVELLEVYLTSNDQRTVVIGEREPFEICVKILFRKSPDIADVGIKFSRADGVYVFWQSSGLSGSNLSNPSGVTTVKFRFDPNKFGASEFYINAHVSDGWLYPNNYPYAQIFARAVNAASFRIVPEMSDLDFGVVNERASIAVITEGKGQTAPANEPIGAAEE